MGNAAASAPRGLVSELADRRPQTQLGGGRTLEPRAPRASREPTAPSPDDSPIHWNLDLDLAWPKPARMHARLSCSVLCAARLTPALSETLAARRATPTRPLDKGPITMPSRAHAKPAPSHRLRRLVAAPEPPRPCHFTPESQIPSSPGSQDLHLPYCGVPVPSSQVSRLLMCAGFTPSRRRLFACFDFICKPLAIVARAQLPSTDPAISTAAACLADVGIGIPARRGCPVRATCRSGQRPAYCRTSDMSAAHRSGGG